MAREKGEDLRILFWLRQGKDFTAWILAHFVPSVRLGLVSATIGDG